MVGVACKTEREVILKVAKYYYETKIVGALKEEKPKKIVQEINEKLKPEDPYYFIDILRIWKEESITTEHVKKVTIGSEGVGKFSKF